MARLASRSLDCEPSEIMENKRNKHVAVYLSYFCSDKLGLFFCVDVFPWVFYCWVGTVYNESLLYGVCQATRASCSPPPPPSSALSRRWVIRQSKSALSMSFASVVVKLLHLRTAHLSVRLHIRSAIHCTLPWTHRDRCNKGAWRGSVRRSAATVVVVIDVNRISIGWKILSLSMRYYKKGGWILY